MRWSDTDDVMMRLSIVIVPSSLHHQTIAIALSYYCAIAPSRLRPKLNSEIVNYLALSGFHNGILEFLSSEAYFTRSATVYEFPTIRIMHCTTMN